MLRTLMNHLRKIDLFRLIIVICCAFAVIFLVLDFIHYSPPFLAQALIVMMNVVGANWIWMGAIALGLSMPLYKKDPGVGNGVIIFMAIVVLIVLLRLLWTLGFDFSLLGRGLYTPQIIEFVLLTAVSFLISLCIQRRPTFMKKLLMRLWKYMTKTP